MTTSLASSTATPDRPELAKAVAQLFATFARLYPLRWAKVHADPKAPDVWLRAFELARLDADSVKLGLQRVAAAGREFPPEAGEFIALCRPSAPSDRAALAEAQRWARGGRVEWSHPAIAAAALDLGEFELRNLPDREIHRTWSAAYGQMLDRYRRGEELRSPTVRQIAHDAGHQPIYAELAEAVNRDRGTPAAVSIERISAALGVR